MHLKNYVVWLVYMVAVATSVSLAFNIDATTQRIITTEEYFIQNEVLRFMSEEGKGILSTAPTQLDGSEEMCNSDLDQTHVCIIVPDTTIPVKHFGLSIVENSTELTVCRPSAVYGCHENSCPKNMCYKMRDHHQQITSSAVQESTNKTVDLVFLIDGSRSMTEAEFNKNKDFIVEIMDSLKNTSIKFAAVQFSTQYNKVFDFNDYEAGTAIDKLMKERHMKDLTMTHKALTYVLYDIFENPEAGASPDSTKVLVLITDGDPADLDRNNIIKKYDEKSIIRLVIGVKEARVDRFKAIASDPKDRNTFKIENYDGLTGILENVETMLKAIDRAEQMTNEMSPSGFSAVFNKITHLQPVNSFTPGLQEYTKKNVELVFLIDGSRSMTEAEFNKNKDFIVEIMDSFKNTSVKFAAVQFSSQYNKVFDFNDYEAGTAIDKLMREPHMRDLTNTHRALTYVLYNIFENPETGASPDSTKVLVLITDGDPSDPDRNNIIKKYDEKSIIRLVIGVREAKLDKLKAISSEPIDRNTFKIENYDGLTGILENFQKIIFTMEDRAEQMSNEMSPSGFSAVFNKACGPSAVQEHNQDYLNTVCFKITHLQPINSFTPGLQEYTKKNVELVFLIDGSRSMTEAEFNKNKDFIVEIMDSFKNTSVKFAAVQFSSQYNKVFDFNDYEAGTAIDKLMREPHMKDLTNTHKALTYVLYDIFENPEAGASPDSTKVVVLITDGDPSDPDRNNIIKKYDEKSIIRLVIGVKEANLDKFRTISSEPQDRNTFRIENYDGLTGILEHFQKIIFTMEAATKPMTNAMSQSGFSAVFYKNSLVLGSVRSNSWRSSVEKLQENKKTPIDDPDMQTDSYIGYSISFGKKSGHLLYFMGAPSFEHTGQVVLFTYNEGNWIFSQRINGEQIGSYFGAELCSLDVNSDNNMDFLLVGAPLFDQAQEKKEGQIYIYRLTNEIQLRSELNVTAPSMGRFGSTISSLADLNGDGLRDIAVGAPLEDDNRGAVYIYLGHRHRGIQSIFSQRITGEKMIPGIRFFGQAIDGNIDAGEDGLPRIVVGSPETSIVLRYG